MMKVHESALTEEPTAVPKSFVFFKNKDQNKISTTASCDTFDSVFSRKCDMCNMLLLKLPRYDTTTMIRPLFSRLAPIRAWTSLGRFGSRGSCPRPARVTRRCPTRPPLASVCDFMWGAAHGQSSASKQNKKSQFLIFSTSKKNQNSGRLCVLDFYFF
jgi:hypothetical protein